MTVIYLDNNATTRVLPEVQGAILDALESGHGNASSVHSAGGVTRSILQGARDHVAALLGIRPGELLFTSGATEANNMVLRSFGREFGGKRIVTSAVEHSSIRRCLAYLAHMGTEVVEVPVGADGTVEPGAIREALSSGTSLVSVQWVNNETGVIQPIEEIGQICREHEVPLHTDAAQAVGRMHIDLSSLPIDYASITGHKFHAPSGIGALYCRTGTEVHPFILGGDQEDGLRAGTENLLGIVGMGAAADVRNRCFDASVTHMRDLRDKFEAELMGLCGGVTINGSPSRVCNTTNLRFADVDGQALVARLDQRGVYCSQSSACTNHRPEPSYVLREMGLSEEEAYASVRFGFSVQNTQDEVDEAVGTICETVESVRSFSAVA